MKTISIQQPWALLVASGIKDIENRSWDTQHRGTILIHASSAKCPKDYYRYLDVKTEQAIVNEQIFGNFPDDVSKFPYSAIIGCCDIAAIVAPGTKVDSVWDAGSEQYRWKLEKACLFDNPVLGVSGKLKLYDYEGVDKSHMPSAQKYQRRLPKVEGHSITIPVTGTVFKLIADSKKFFLQNPGGVDYCTDLFDSKGEVKDIQELTVVDTDGNTATYDVGVFTTSNMSPSDCNLWLGHPMKNGNATDYHAFMFNRLRRIM